MSPTELQEENKDYRSQLSLQMMLTKGPRGYDGYHMAQAGNGGGKEGMMERKGNLDSWTKGKAAPFHPMGSGPLRPRGKRGDRG